MGDHGWQLGNHGLWHKHTNFEIATRAPSLICVPGSKSVGQTCEAPVEFIDVIPPWPKPPVCQLRRRSTRSLKNFIDDPAAPATDVAISQYPRKAPEGNVMGYSIRDTRWRCTFWRERGGEKIVATELYDEQNDPAETVNASGNPEHKELIASLAKHLPPAGSDLDPNAKPQGNTKPATSPPAEDRGLKFDRINKDKAEKLPGRRASKASRMPRLPRSASRGSTETRMGCFPVRSSSRQGSRHEIAHPFHGSPLRTQRFRGGDQAQCHLYPG